MKTTSPASLGSLTPDLEGLPTSQPHSPRIPPAKGGADLSQKVHLPSKPKKC